MTPLNDHEIERIACGLKDRTLPKREWTHAAHFAAAIWVLRHHGSEAERLMPGLIRAYNEATGVPNTDLDGYHETITLASLRAARFMLSGRPDATLGEVHAALMAREFGASNWPLAYWRKETLFSTEARRLWVEPDIQALPF